MFVFELPPYYLVSFFKEWISLKELCFLDSSICNAVERTNFHHVIKVHRENSLDEEIQHVIKLQYFVFSSQLQQLTSHKKVLKVYIKHGAAQFKKNADFAKYMLLIGNCVQFEDNFAFQTGNYDFSVSQMFSNFSNIKTDNSFGIEIDELFTNWYIGEFRNGKREGFGNQYWRYGVKSFVKFQPFHSSDMLCTPGSYCYSGEWLDDKCHGYGVMKYKIGDVYTGQWVAHQRHGHGSMRYGDGSRFVGQWQNGYRVFENSD